MATHATNVASDNALPFYYATIDGIPLRFHTHAAPNWAEGEHVDIDFTLSVESIKLPDESITPDKPIPSPGGVDLVLFETSENVLALGTFNIYSPTGLRCALMADVPKSAAAGQTITVDDNSAFPATGPIYIGNELISYTGKGGGNTTFTGCTRGVSSSQVMNHRFDASLQEGELVSNHAVHWQGRRVKVYRNFKDDRGSAFDTAYGGGNEKLLYTGYVKEIRQPTHREAKFVIVTNSLLAELRRPINMHLAKTTLADLDFSGLYISGFDRMQIQVDDVPKGNSRLHDVRLVAVMGGAGPFSRDEIIDAMSNSIMGFLDDGSWPDRPGGNLGAALFGGITFSAGGNPDADNNRTHLICTWSADEAFSFRLFANWRFHTSSIFSALGFDEDLFVDQQVVPNANMWHDEIAPNALPRFLVHPHTDRIYVHDATEFVADQGIPGEDNGLSYVIVEDADVKEIFAIDGINTAGGADSHYLEVSRANMPLRPWGSPPHRFINNRPPQMIVARPEDEASPGAPEVRQVLVFRNKATEDVLRYLMMSSGISGYNHAAWDLIGLKDAGLDLRGEDIDIDSFDAAEGHGGAPFKRMWLFDKAINLDKEMHPYLVAEGRMLIQRSGKIAMRSWAQAAVFLRNDFVHVDHSMHVGVIRTSGGIVEQINAVALKLGYDPLRDGWKYDEVLVQNKYSVDASGVKALRLTLPSYYPTGRNQPLSASMAIGVIWLLNVLGRPLPVVEFEADAKAHEVWLGDLIKLTANGIWNPASATGYDYTAIVFQVVGRQHDDKTGVTSLKAITMSGRGEKIGPYAPSAKLTGYNAGPPVSLVVGNNYFSVGTDAHGSSQTDHEFFKRIVDTHGSCKARIFREFDRSVQDDVLITSVNVVQQRLYLSAAPSFVPTAGDRVRARSWDDAETTMKEHAFQADATPTLGAGSDEAFKWGVLGGRM